jgi:hypothetical protein
MLQSNPLELYLPIETADFFKYNNTGSNGRLLQLEKTNTCGRNEQ